MTSAATASSINYFKRYRMEIDLRGPLLPVPILPEEYAWLPWEDTLLHTHAEVKVRCFLEELDAIVFPNLSHREGCLWLMREIVSKAGFVPGSTWLLTHEGRGCATVQGVSDRRGTGAIQNLGVVAAHRGRGLGAALLLKALHGFRSAGLVKGMLEVTAQNETAVRLYRRLGFRCRKTIYKIVDPRPLLLLPDVPQNEWCV